MQSDWASQFVTLVVPIRSISHGCFDLFGGISPSLCSKGGSVAFLRIPLWEHNDHVLVGMGIVRYFYAGALQVDCSLSSATNAWYFVFPCLCAAC
jgi:hypothetical protein